ncbi:pantothenate synthetase [Syntrophus gentianae]|uniref:Pantothenate synthetase n=2 Tax=Syntrophus gentianae TaxID=43775 RepID=A0A1H7XJX5_9BACT|nr:pantoate--beta-alanine ligase [Syntrophus gentianae]SEM34061.1 pantothenate synthetase [Syntrophus gentianae]
MGNNQPMKIIATVPEMQRYSEALRNSGKKIAFVPTMGYFHDGHLNLMREARKQGDCVVISIYVNPTQFGPSEDLEKYPRNFERDSKLAEEVGVDVIFFPSNAEMYPDHYQTYVTVEEVTKNLCGLSRPVHFRGVATVCAKLFNMVKPHMAIFGKKDFQQLVTIKRMVSDLNMDLQIFGLPTTRETDGLAMSSRNVYLSPEERQSALCLSLSLKKAKESYDQGERDAGRILESITNYIKGIPFTRIDYIKICDTTTMQDVSSLEKESVLALAVFVGSTRLIDNYVFGEELNIE